MKDIVLFGAGKKLMQTLKICRLLGSFHVIEVWDHAPKRDSVRDGEVEIPVVHPHVMQTPLPVYILPRRYEAEIRSQLLSETGLPQRMLFSFWDLFADCRNSIIKQYADTKNPEVQRAIQFISEHGLRVFPDASVEKLYAQEGRIPVTYDDAAGLWYGDWHGRRLYMKRGMTKNHAQTYLMSLIAEQSSHSAHNYFVGNEELPFDTVVDCGAAEGCFALDYLGKVKDIYLFEGDEGWKESLKRTFVHGGGTKIHLLPCWVGSHMDEHCMTIDALGLSGRNLLIKMDVEGDECNVLAGAERTMRENLAIRVIACSYHRHRDEEKIALFLLEHHFQVHYSHGFMFFPYGDSIEPELRHGLVFGDKKNFRVNRMS